MNEEELLNGQILLVDKPLNWSSFQAVNKIKYAIKRKFPALKKIKIGHAGTLDPLATGLLIICTGKFTKKITEIQSQQKQYTGTFYLGATTPSYDLETQINATFSIDHISEELLLKTANNFIGEIYQKPPIFSAIKKNGKRLYEHARAGEDVEILPRKTIIYEFVLTEINLPNINFLVTCSKGTYIRSLANDFGASLNCGAYLKELRRTKIGAYSVENAFLPENII